MKRLLPVFLLLPLLAGCVTMERLDSVKSSGEKLIDDALESAALATTLPDGSLLTREEAEEIALNHSGLQRDQVQRLRTEYDWDDGIHTYEVEFYRGTREYSYEIDAETGKILSVEMDD